MKTENAIGLSSGSHGTPYWRLSIRFLLLPLAVVFFAGVSQRAWAGNINLATGLNSSGGLIGTGGQNDANWTVQEQAGGIGPAQTVFPGDADWFGGRIGNGPNSDWIGRNANNCCNGPAPYSFFRTFDLSGNLSNVMISGFWTIDDGGTLSLNGNVIGTLVSGDWGQLWAFTVPAGSPFFQQGLNTLTLTITDSDDNLEGVRLEGTLSGTNSSTPEPSALLLLGSGLLGVAGGLRRKLFVS